MERNTRLELYRALMIERYTPQRIQLARWWPRDEQMDPLAAKVLANERERTAKQMASMRRKRARS